MQSGTVPDCFRCGSALFTPEQAAELAAQIPIAASLRAEAGVHEGRLAVCASCEALREAVLCAHCGCFVVFRARVQEGYCPHPAGDKWESLSGGS
jgi:hypothetical protein